MLRRSEAGAGTRGRRESLQNTVDNFVNIESYNNEIMK